MKSLLSCVAAMVFMTVAAFSQQENYGKTWVHGRQRPYLTDASTSSLTSVFWDTVINTPQIWLRANASNICNAAGIPIIVTNGFRIWDGNHNLIDNGDTICPTIHFASDEYNNQLQKTMTLPVGDSIYYVFSNNISDSLKLGLKTLPKGGYDLLQYAVVDMTANNYAGKVTSKRNIIWKDSSLSLSEMTAVRHGNGKDWWLVKRGIHLNNDSSIFYVYRVKKDSIIGPDIQRFKVRNCFGSWIGQSAFNSKGNKFATVNRGDTILLADFDRCSGKLSNFLEIENAPVVSTYNGASIIDSAVGGLAFSPNDSFLYACMPYAIVQYDLFDANMIQNRQTIAEFDTLPPNANKYVGLYLSPGGRIYTGSDNSNISSWSVIEHPNLPGLASGFCGRCQQFPKFGPGLTAAFPQAPPNMPNYALGALPNACGNGLGVAATQGREGSCRVYPNPASDQVFIHYAFDRQVSSAAFELRDMMGNLVVRTALTADAEFTTLDLSKLPTGLYHYRVVADGAQVSGGKLLKQ